MKNMNCEDILIQKMALIDGEKVGFSDEQIAAHLAGCENCCREAGLLENTIVLLTRQTRREQTADLWSAIETRINAEPETIFKIDRQLFILLGVLLAVNKLLEMVPERDFGWALKIVPFVLIAAVFGFLKENPFKINTELILEK